MRFRAGPRPDTHICPKEGCEVVVPDSMLACRGDWFALPPDLRRLVYQTRHLPPYNPQRLEVLGDVAQAWGDTADEIEGGA